jgi:hypothetical protein
MDILSNLVSKKYLIETVMKNITEVKFISVEQMARIDISTVSDTEIAVTRMAWRENGNTGSVF